MMLTQASGREARRWAEAEPAGGLAQGGGHAEMGLLVFFFETWPLKKVLLGIFMFICFNSSSDSWKMHEE